MVKNLLIALLTISTGLLAVLTFVPKAPLRNGPVVRSASVAPAAPAGQAAALEGKLEDAAAENRRSDALIRELRGEISILQARRSAGPTGRLGSDVLPVPRAVLRELLGKPETVRLAMDWIKSDLRRRYASLIALQTQLSAAQREQLLDLLAERYATRMDLAAAGTIDLAPGMEGKFDDDYQAKLAQLVGEDGAALFEKSEVKPVSWDRMQRLDERLRYEATPLNPQQYAALWPILSEAVFYYRPPTSDDAAAALIQQRMAGNQKALTQAGALLDPAQMKVLTGLLNDDLATWRVQLYMMTKLNQQRSAPPAAAGGSSPDSH